MNVSLGYPWLQKFKAALPVDEVVLVMTGLSPSFKKSSNSIYDNCSFIDKLIFSAFKTDIGIGIPEVKEPAALVIEPGGTA